MFRFVAGDGDILAESNAKADHATTDIKICAWATPLGQFSWIWKRPIPKIGRTIVRVSPIRIPL